MCTWNGVNQIYRMDGQSQFTNYTPFTFFLISTLPAKPPENQCRPSLAPSRALNGLYWIKSTKKIKITITIQNLVLIIPRICKLIHHQCRFHCINSSLQLDLSSEPKEKKKQFDCLEIYYGVLENGVCGSFTGFGGGGVGEVVKPAAEGGPICLKLDGGASQRWGPSKVSLFGSF